MNAAFQIKWDRVLDSVAQPLTPRDPQRRGGDYRGGSSFTSLSLIKDPLSASPSEPHPSEWIQLTFAELLAATLVEALALPGAARRHRQRRREVAGVRARLEHRQAELVAELTARTSLQARRDREKSWTRYGASVAALRSDGRRRGKLIQRLSILDPSVLSSARKSTRQKERILAEAIEREEAAILFVLRELGARPNLTDAELLNQAPTANPERSKGWDRVIEWREQNPQYFRPSVVA